MLEGGKKESSQHVGRNIKTKKIRNNKETQTDREMKEKKKRLFQPLSMHCDGERKHKGKIEKKKLK